MAKMVNWVKITILIFSVIIPVFVSAGIGIYENNMEKYFNEQHIPEEEKGCYEYTAWKEGEL